MPWSLALLPAVLFLAPIVLFVLLRWWIGKTGPTILLTSSLILNLTLFGPLVLAILLAVEVRDFQDKMATASKVLLVERGPDLLLAVSFTEVKGLEQGVSSFKPLGQEEIARLTPLGEARHEALTKDYYKVFVVKREFLEKLAASAKPLPQGPQGSPGSGGPAAMDPFAIMGLLGSAGEAFMSGDLDRVARQAADLQKGFGEPGMGEAAGLARQMEQASRAKDPKALESLRAGLALPKEGLAQLAPSAGGGLLGSGGLPALPLSGDIILKAIEAEDPAQALSPYLPVQALQEMGGGDVTGLKLALLAFLLQARGFDPLLLLREYQAGHILVYPASTVSTLVKLLPLAVLPGGITTP